VLGPIANMTVALAAGCCRGILRKQPFDRPHHANIGDSRSAIGRCPEARPKGAITFRSTTRSAATAAAHEFAAAYSIAVRRGPSHGRGSWSGAAAVRLSFVGKTGEGRQCYETDSSRRRASPQPMAHERLVPDSRGSGARRSLFGSWRDQCRIGRGLEFFEACRRIRELGARRPRAYPGDLEQWLGQAPSSVVGCGFFTPNRPWQDFFRLSWVPGIWKNLNPARNVVWSVPLTVEGTPLADVADGRHDAEI